MFRATRKNGTHHKCAVRANDHVTTNFDGDLKKRPVVVFVDIFGTIWILPFWT